MVEVVYVEGVGFGVVEWCVDVDVVVVGFCVFGYDVYCCDFVLCGVVYVGCDGCVKVWQVGDCMVGWYYGYYCIVVVGDKLQCGECQCGCGVVVEWFEYDGCVFGCQVQLFGGCEVMIFVVYDQYVVVQWVIGCQVVEVQCG